MLVFHSVSSMWEYIFKYVIVPLIGEDTGRIVEVGWTRSMLILFQKLSF